MCFQIYINYNIIHGFVEGIRFDDTLLAVQIQARSQSLANATKGLPGNATVAQCKYSIILHIQQCATLARFLSKMQRSWVDDMLSCST